MDNHQRICSVYDTRAYDSASELLNNSLLNTRDEISRLLQHLDMLLADNEIDYTTQVFSFVADCISYSDLKLPLQKWLATRISMAAANPIVQGEISVACLDHIPETPLIIEDLLWLFSLLDHPNTVWAVPIAYTEFEDKHERLESHYNIYRYVLNKVHGRDPIVSIIQLHELLNDT